MSRKEALVFVVALVTSLIAGAAVPAPAAAQSDTVTLTVSVVDQTGSPVGSARLTVAWDGGDRSVTTASNGKAFVDVPGGADLTVTVSHPNYVRNYPLSVDDASEREVEMDVHRKGSATIRVTDSAGNAVEGARVTMSKDLRDVATGTTGASGTFESGTVEQGDYTITVVKPGYFSRTKTVPVDGEVTNTFALRSGSVTVEVTVVDRHFEPAEPVQDARVELEGIGTLNTLRNGEASTRVPVNTDLQMTVTKDGYRTISRELEVGESDVQQTLAISRIPSLTLEAANDRVVAGERVVVTAIDQYGDPVEGASVALDGTTVGRTNANGELAVRVENPGEHSIRASTDRATSNSVTVEAISGTTATPAPTETATATPAGTPTATATPTATPTETSLVGPGFTPVLAVLALLAVSFLLRRKR